MYPWYRRSMWSLNTGSSRCIPDTEDPCDPLILDRLGVSLIQKIHVIHNLVYVNNSVRYTLVVSYALVIRYLLFKHVISYLLSCYLSMLSVTCYLVMSNICYMEVLFAILIFMTETISRTDEGQPKYSQIYYSLKNPKYWDKCSYTHNLLTVTNRTHKSARIRRLC